MSTHQFRFCYKWESSLSHFSSFPNAFPQSVILWNESVMVRFVCVCWFVWSLNVKDTTGYGLYSCNKNPFSQGSSLSIWSSACKPLYSLVYVIIKYFSKLFTFIVSMLSHPQEPRRTYFQEV